MANILINWDWVQFTAHCPNVEINLKGNFLFSAEKQKQGSAYFKEQYKVFLLDGIQGEHFAEIEALPRVSFIKGDIIRVKICNRYLYDERLFSNIKQLLFELQANFINFTRLDVCADFRETTICSDNNQQLLKHFANFELRIKGKRKIAIYADGSEYTGITIGSRLSGCGVTIYNKSRELREKSNKPWIVKLWESNGWADETDTYRLEFSTSKECKRTDTERVKQVSESEPKQGYLFKKIETIKDPVAFFNHQYKNNFNVILKDNEKTERCTTVEVLEVQNSIYVKAPVCTFEKSTNYTKAHIKKLAAEALLLPETEQLTRHYITRHIEQLCTRYGLVVWFENTCGWAAPLSTGTTIADVATLLAQKNSEYMYNLRAKFGQSELIYN
jgi:hypothetical protein